MSEEFEGECPIHGSCTFVTTTKGTKSERIRCKKCRTEAVQRRRWKIKELAIKYLGGNCVNCGYNKCVAALHFHHKDPSKKDFGISSKGITRSWDKVKIELDKCKLLCANCHAEEHHSSRKSLDINVKIICVECDKEFISNSKRQKYCSPRCKNSFHNRKRKL